MLRFNILLFDYDGTLAITRAAVAECLLRTLAEHGVPTPEPSELTRVIASGVPLEAAFGTLIPGITEDDRALAVQRYRGHYPEVDRRATMLFDGVADTLAALHRQGASIVVLSNKGRVAVEAALERFDLAHRVTAIFAADPGQPNKPDPLAFTRRVKPMFPRAELGDFLMIGDTAADLAFARACGIASCWASYGYGDPGQCRELLPNFEIDHFPGLLALAG